MDHYNYGLLLIIDSDDSKNDEMNRKAVNNLKSVAEEIRHNMMVSFCDVSQQALCRELVVMFELEDHQLPLVRMIYRMNDHSKEEVGQEQLFFKFSFDRNIYKETIDNLKEGKETEEMKRLEQDTNGNIWLEDLTPEGFKAISNGYKKGKLEVDMRSQQFSKTSYNEAVLVFTPENGNLYLRKITQRFTESARRAVLPVFIRFCSHLYFYSFFN